MKLRMNPKEFDKYHEYQVDFHGNVPHTEDEVDPNGATIDDWHTRHQDKNLEAIQANMLKY